MRNDKLDLEIQLFGATNSTTNYNLSQYVGSDKPTYLGDYNSDMLKIDTGMKANQTASSTNASSITTINTNIGTMGSLETTAPTLVGGINEVVGTIGDLSDLTAPVKTSVVNAINSVNTNVGNPTDLYTDAKTNLVAAVNEIVNKFNLTTFENPTNLTTNKGTITSTSANLHVAKNSDGSLAKIYGTIAVGSIPLNTSSITVSFQTTLQPAENITINCLQFNRQYGNNTDVVSNVGSIELSTSGVVSITMATYNTTTTADFKILPCLLFVKDFGDIPVQE